MLITLVGCNNHNDTDNRGNEATQSEQGDLSQQYAFVIPKALFGGGTAERVVEEYTNPDNTFLLKTGEEVPVSEMISDAQINADGTVTLYFTSEQLKRYRSLLYDTATLYTYMKTYPDTSIKSTEFSNDDLTDIIVYVDSSTYENMGRDGIFANGYTTTYMGLYQVTGGVDPYEWSVHVTVKDYKTGKVITEDYYPNG
jgi:hypothetical protein